MGHGVDMSLDAEFARKVADAAESMGEKDLEGGAMMPEKGPAFKKFEMPLSWLASIGMSTELKYNPDQVPPLMSFGDWMTLDARKLEDMPKSVKDEVKKLQDSADGLKFVNIRGLPGKQEIVIEF